MFLPSDWGNLAWSCLSETYLKFFNIPFFDVTIHMINHLSKSESEIDKKNMLYVYHIRTIGISYVRCTTISASEEVVYQIRTIALHHPVENDTPIALLQGVGNQSPCGFRDYRSYEPWYASSSFFFYSFPIFCFSLAPYSFSMSFLAEVIIKRVNQLIKLYIFIIL